MNFYMPVRLICGDKAVEKNAALFSGFGKRCLIVTGGSGAEKSGALADVTAALEAQGISYDHYAGIEQNPSVASCMEAGRMAAAFDADFVIGIGGGSSMDASKTVAIIAANPAVTEEKLFAFRFEKPPIPVVLVGTTAGTGSEVTKISVLTGSDGKKRSVKTDAMYAKLSFGDPRYTLSLSPHFTLSTGLDALAHCVESYFSKLADEISRSFSVRGIRILLERLPEIGEGTTLTLAQRTDLYEASILGGMAINNAGTVFPHNVGYVLTEGYRIPHGLASACFMPDLMAHVKTAAPELSAAFYREIGMEEEVFVALVKALLPEIRVKMTPEQIRRELPRWEKNPQRINTVGNLTLDDIERILLRRFT